MPFTPFHFGPSIAFSFWDYKKKRIDLASAVVGSIIIDIRATYIFFFGGGNFHGILHSFLSAVWLGLLVAIVLHLKFVKKLLRAPLKFIDWEQDTNFFVKLYSAISMTLLHVLLDSFLYTDIRPLNPFSAENPFLGLISSQNTYLFCIFCFLLGIGEYIGYLYWKKSKTSD
jgi:membrane-bound metal-dependent hydrolase YbcI (DUF457 family)